jgi:ribose-phosphate pyrophosphokinase
MFKQIKGADVVIVDDLVDTGRTLTEMSRRIKELGGNNIYALASHGLFEGMTD